MHISLLTVEFRLEGCRSLKEKRKRLSGIRNRIGKLVNTAVCESGFQNEHQRAEWSFVVVALDNKSISRTISSIENDIELKTDALVVNFNHEKL